MNWKMIPETYQPDSADSRKESGLKYTKMYDETYVKELIRLIEDLTDTVHVAANKSKDRGFQRAAIPLLKHGYETVKGFKK